MRRPLGRHRRLRLREVDDELGAMRREQVLAQQHGAAGVVGGGSLAPQHRRPGGDAQESGVGLADEIGADGLGGSSQFHVEQLVERSPLDVAP
jgi:hypothetical protein